MTKTRRLTDLYVRGREVEILEKDREGNTVDSETVWMKKLNPVEAERAFRMANSKRAKVLAISRFPESDEFMAFVSEAADLGESDNLIEFVILPELAEATVAAEAKVASKEEWKKDDYIQGLKDAWTQELQDHLATNPEDEESRRVRDELKRFSDAVEEELKDRKEVLILQYEGKPYEELLDLAAKRLVKVQADLEWSKEFRRCQIWMATKVLDDHKSDYFENRDEVDDLQREIFEQLEKAYNDLSVDPIEVKDSEVTPTSLPSADQPKQEATGESSTPLAVVR